jgi:ABC-type multidrug transport system fused ATPase/permease subunit
LLPYARPHLRLLSLSAVLMVAAVVASLGAPWPLALLVDSALGHRPAPGWLQDLDVDSPGRLVAVAVVAGIVLVLASSG